MQSEISNFWDEGDFLYELSFVVFRNAKWTVSLRIFAPDIKKAEKFAREEIKSLFSPRKIMNNPKIKLVALSDKAAEIWREELMFRGEVFFTRSDSLRLDRALARRLEKCQNIMG